MARAAGLTTLPDAMISIQELSDRRNHINGIMIELTEAFTQNIHLPVDFEMLVNDAMILILHFAVPAFNPDSGVTKVLFGNCNPQPFGKILEFLK